MDIENYQSMIQAFVDGRLPIQEFETQYLAAFKSQSTGMNPELFQLLDSLFSDVDAYSPDCLPEEETPFIISALSLYKQAAITLEKLNQILVKQTQQIVK
ncbi:colicin immunity domain-containing protein [Aphanothece sacrum]|uniref:Transcription-repair coupling factor n=1 Tax=Aphanothece sacrum FPU1 TaxID=1920663 RepID=A0A401ILS4_APHSA|nr:colicin immunity domain-containing protein [Aphanothece sacrum]GBF82202.1 transcription-repair coupling factor [Aphanothece sacrum FPU1]GBF87260.1 transcription-repair coupling factor [Aphanothece sacrum FPU3]